MPKCPTTHMLGNLQLCCCFALRSQNRVISRANRSHAISCTRLYASECGSAFWIRRPRRIQSSFQEVLTGDKSKIHTDGALHSRIRHLPVFPGTYPAYLQPLGTFLYKFSTTLLFAAAFCCSIYGIEFHERPDSEIFFQVVSRTSARRIGDVNPGFNAPTLISGFFGVNWAGKRTNEGQMLPIRVEFGHPSLE